MQSRAYDVPGKLVMEVPGGALLPKPFLSNSLLFLGRGGKSVIFESPALNHRRTTFIKFVSLFLILFGLSFLRECAAGSLRT